MQTPQYVNNYSPPVGQLVLVYSNAEGYCLRFRSVDADGANEWYTDADDLVDIDVDYKYWWELPDAPK